MSQQLAVAAEYGRSVLEIVGRSGGVLSEVDFSLGGETIRIGFQSAILGRRFLPALQHLSPSTDAAALRILLCDSRDFASLPMFPWPSDIYRGCGEMPGYSDGDVYIHFDVSMGALTVLDRVTGQACYVSRSPDALPDYECASPLRFLLHRFFVDRGMALVHSGAVAHGARAALIAGPRGAGKSTTTLSCVAAGFSYLGDDRCLLQRHESPKVHAVYSSAKVFTGELSRFPIPGLRDAVAASVPVGELKSIIQMDEAAPHLMTGQAELACIVAPVVSGQPRSRLVEIPAAEAVKLLVAEIVGFSPTTAARSLSILTDICRRRRCFRLEAGRDLREVAEAVADAIDKA